MFVDVMHGTVPRIAGDQAENRAADCFSQKQLSHRYGIDVTPVAAAARCDCDHDREHDDTDAVVEKRFTGHFGFQCLRDFHCLEKPENCDRIGRADQSAEDERPDKRHLDADGI